MADALDGMLEQMDAHVACQHVELPPDPYPLSTGLPALDRVCGGGIHLGRLVVIEADLEAQGRALLSSVARRIAFFTLLAGASEKESTRWLVAGETGIPASILKRADLTETEWQTMGTALPSLASRAVSGTEAPSLPGLWHLVETTGSTVVLVDGLDRLGPPEEMVRGLTRLGAALGVAVVASASPFNPLDESFEDEFERVAMAAHGLGGRASLCRADPHDGFLTAQLTFNCVTGVIE